MILINVVLNAFGSVVKKYDSRNSVERNLTTKYPVDAVRAYVSANQANIVTIKSLAIDGRRMIRMQMPSDMRFGMHL